jgi:crotonobetainyl-CoA:carnitine CoA-transferase CaiB-like acyl-CoA transferase
LATQALEGLKVVDFSWYIAGPSITMWLAHHGAKVIRIESLTRPDELRGIEPFKDGVAGINRSGCYANYNSNKYGMSLNLNHPKGVVVARRTIAWADVIVENFTPGTMERKWGLGYDGAKKIKPDIIMLSSSTQGQTGPEAQQAGFGLELASRSGFTHFVGWPDQEAVGVGYPYTDTVTPPVGVIAIMAALEYRRRTGKGQYIDLSQLEVGVQYLAPALLNYTVNRCEGGRIGNHHPEAAPHGAYRCQGEDRWCAVAVFKDEEWQAFCNVLGNPAWTRDSKFATGRSRKANEEELDQRVESWTSTLPPEEVMRRMQEAGIAAGVVQNGKDLIEDPQLRYRHHFWYLNHPEMGTCAYDGPPFKLSETPAELSMPAPCLGEHTEYVCTQILGMSDEEFVELLAEGVFE